MTPAPPPPQGDDVLELVHQVMHRARAQRQRLLREAGHDLTPMEVRVLAFFSRQPGATLSALVAHSGHDKAQVARLLKGLRERGLLEDAASTGDRRQQPLQASAAGRQLQQRLQQQGRRLAARAVGGLSGDERDTLARLLQRVYGNLEN